MFACVLSECRLDLEIPDFDFGERSDSESSDDPDGREIDYSDDPDEFEHSDSGSRDLLDDSDSYQRESYDHSVSESYDEN